MLKLLRYLKKYWWAAILAPLFMIGEVAMEVCMPYIMSLVMDSLENATATNNLNLIWPYVAILICMALFFFVMRSFSR